MCRLLRLNVRMIGWALVMATFLVAPQWVLASDMDGADSADVAPGQLLEGTYRLHVGSFLDMEEAVDEMSRLKAEGCETYFDLGEDGPYVWTRIYMGNFETYPEAEKMGDGLLRREIIQAYYVEEREDGDGKELSGEKAWRRYEADDGGDETVWPRQSIPNMSGLSDDKPGRFSLGLRAGWYVVPDIKSFEIVEFDKNESTTWRLDGRNVISLSIPMSFQVLENVWLEGRPEISVVDDISVFFFSMGPRVGIRPSLLKGIRPYVRAGLVYGVFRWEDVPGKFDNGIGWEGGGGVCWGSATFTYGADIQYRDIQFVYNRPDDGLLFINEEEIDFSGYAVSVSFEYLF